MSDLFASDPDSQLVPMPDGSGYLAYRRLGRGPKVLLAFHGFGQDGHIFDPLALTLGEEFTVYAVDAFFHGQSQLAPDRLLAKSDWWMLIDALLDRENIRRFGVLGFSLGGRFALATVEAYAARIDAVHLVAPDGITRSWWYELATESEPGRGFFRWFLHRLSFWNRIGDGLARVGLLNRATLRFAEGTLARPDQRQQLFNTWTRLRRIRPDLNLITSLLNNLPIQVRFYVGLHDRIVPPSYVQPLLHRLKNADLTTFPVGHNRLLEKVAESMDEQPLDR
jgi:pimeloyl-ACP methyl ester carboxylesterase